jgi:hypothetical protein
MFSVTRGTVPAASSSCRVNRASAPGMTWSQCGTAWSDLAGTVPRVTLNISRPA